jgi:hypothetical protein
MMKEINTKYTRQNITAGCAMPQSLISNALNVRVCPCSSVSVRVPLYFGA